MHYILNTESNLDNNHIAPQIVSMGPGYDWDAPNSVSRLTTNVVLVQAPNFRSFHLDPNTAVTDIVSQTYVAARGLLVSPALAGAIGQFTIQRHQPYRAEIVWRGVAFDYYWLHMTEEAEDLLDYARSDFRRMPIGPGSPVNVSFANREELRVTTHQLINTLTGQLQPRRLIFLPGIPELHLFCLDLPHRTFYLSSRLGDELTAAKLTGFELVPSDVEVAFR
jgi:hypothetical protein